jgi:phospholipase/carboxylesterase
MWFAGAAALLATGLVWFVAIREPSAPGAGSEATYRRTVSDAAFAARDFLAWLDGAAERIAPDRLVEFAAEAKEQAKRLHGSRLALDELDPGEALASFAERFESAFDHAFDASRLLARPPQGSIEQSVPQLFGGLEEAALAEEGFYHLRKEVAEVADLWPPLPAEDSASGSGEASSPRGIVHVERGGHHGGFTLYVPEDYSPQARWPVVIALHGAGSDGRHFIWNWMREARRRGYLVLAPKALRPTWSLEDDEGLLEILGWLQGQYNVEGDRILLTGFSDGASFTIVFGLLHPRAFRALAPISGVFLPVNETVNSLERARGVPIYLVHGALDFIFPIAKARETHARLESAGAAVTYRERGDLSHVYPRSENARILDWFDSLS